LTTLSAPNRMIRSLTLAALSLLATVTIAGQEAKSPDQQSDTRLNTITVEAQRATLEKRIRTFVSAIAVAPYQESLARWEDPTLICPLVGGLPRDDGEFILTRLSSIALAAGAPLGPARCRPNFYIIVTSEPDALIKAWVSVTSPCSAMNREQQESRSLSTRQIPYAPGTTPLCIPQKECRSLSCLRGL
jgi:hypothetical protein